MSEFNYLVEKRRMLDSIGRVDGAYVCNASCEKCPLSYSSNGKAQSCTAFELNHPEKAIEIVRKWSEEHPVITNADKFVELFEEAFRTDIKISKSGLSQATCDLVKCPDLDLECETCWIKEFWNKEYKEPKE